MIDTGTEPTIDVGLVEKTVSAAVRLHSDFTDVSGRTLTKGDYRVTCQAGSLTCSGETSFDAQELELTPVDESNGRFSLEATIGIDFHWQQKEHQTFRGGLRFLPRQEDRITVINRVPLETYLTSVICSEMRSSSPPDLARAHAVISRSWLLAQLESRGAGSPRPAREGERIVWYDRQVHEDFDVCADDHCQRYQGIGKVDTPEVAAAVRSTRGLVLSYQGKICDARFSKCCGGVTEDFRSAWSDTQVPYLVPVSDGPEPGLPQPPLTDESAMREYVAHPPDAHCNCSDSGILDRVLNPYDLETRDFFRWRFRLEADELSTLVESKLQAGLGRILALQPDRRGQSGRLTRLRLVGEQGSLTIGKELEIRRALSPTHLYSSAFVVDSQGPAERPEAFVLAGAGWGHGVGLCQIGAAVMAVKGTGYVEILKHYYPGTTLENPYR